MFRRKKQPQEESPSSEKPSASQTTKATVKNMGTGDLEFSDNTLKFILKKGFLGKKKDVAITIPVDSIENMKHEGDQFTIVWNGITDNFTIQKPEEFKSISEKLTAALNSKPQEKTSTEEETPEQKEKAEAQKLMVQQVPQQLNSAEEIIDPLFDLLRTLQGKINWKLAEDHLRNAKQNAEAFRDQTQGAVTFDFTKLASEVKAHVPGETGKETYNLLNQLGEYFSALAAKTEATADVHPNYRDAVSALRAYSMLNDIVLGVEVNDDDVVRESFEFSKTLDQLAQKGESKLDASILKESVAKLARTKGTANSVVECRALLRAYLFEFTKPRELPADFQEPKNQSELPSD